MNKIAVFDIDNVIVSGQTQRLLLFFLLKNNKISVYFFIKYIFWFLGYKIGLFQDLDYARAKAYKVFQGWKVKDMENLFQDFFEEELRPCLNLKMISLLEEHKKDGYKILLLSASLEGIVKCIADYLNVNHFIGTKLLKNNELYTGKYDLNVPYGLNKVTLLDLHIEQYGYILDKSYAYADHISDYPLLNSVSNPVAVNADKELCKIARKRKWVTYDF